MKILISNDDGVFSKGIGVLQKVMSGFGETIVVAPQSDQSGMAHALTLYRPLRVQKTDSDHYVLDGSPADCIHFAVQDLFKGQKPDLVVSGVNHGANLGEDVWYSGTVGAAIEGSLMGIRSIAVSTVNFDSSELHFDATIDFLQNKLMKLLEMGPKRHDIIYNINVPSAKAPIDHIEFTRLGSDRYRSTLVSKVDPRGKAYFWIGGERKEFESVEGTDSNALRQRHISVTPIHLNITATEHLEALKKCAF